MRAKPPGLRERHRIDKLDRISIAAKRLFARDGYEGATLREIAREADVALGTLVYYARDKRDLILLIFNRLVPPLIEEGWKTAASAGPLAPRLLALFAPTYEAFARDVTLYRIVLGQIYGDPASLHAVETAAFRARLIEEIGDIIRSAADAGECTKEIDVAVHARIFYFLNFGAVRAWLSEEDPMPERGMVELERLFTAHITGMRI